MPDQTESIGGPDPQRPADYLPEYACGNRRKLEAVGKLVEAVRHATDKGGASNSANNAERLAWKRFLRAEGYTMAKAEELAEILFDRFV